MLSHLCGCRVFRWFVFYQLFGWSWLNDEYTIYYKHCTGLHLTRLPTKLYNCYTCLVQLSSAMTLHINFTGSFILLHSTKQILLILESTLPVPDSTGQTLQWFSSWLYLTLHTSLSNGSNLPDFTGLYYLTFSSLANVKDAVFWCNCWSHRK